LSALELSPLVLDVAGGDEQFPLYVGGSSPE
jgi:hypothetical protein